MSTNCHDCGYRDTEVKSGGATSERGRKITLKVEDSDDLSRDILKVRGTAASSVSMVLMRYLPERNGWAHHSRD